MSGPSIPGNPQDRVYEFLMFVKRQNVPAGDPALAPYTDALKRINEAAAEGGWPADLHDDAIEALKPLKRRCTLEWLRANGKPSTPDEFAEHTRKLEFEAALERSKQITQLKTIFAELGLEWSEEEPSVVLVSGMRKLSPEEEQASRKAEMSGLLQQSCESAMHYLNPLTRGRTTSSPDQETSDQSGTASKDQVVLPPNPSGPIDRFLRALSRVLGYRGESR